MLVLHRLHGIALRFLWKIIAPAHRRGWLDLHPVLDETGKRAWLHCHGLGFSISKLCVDGPDEELKLTENTQPAILAPSLAMLAAIRERSKIEPDIVAGHSLSEYSAIVSAGGLTAPGFILSVAATCSEGSSDA